MTPEKILQMAQDLRVSCEKDGPTKWNRTKLHRLERDIHKLIEEKGYTDLVADEWHSRKEIAEAIGVSPLYVKTWGEQLGLKTRRIGRNMCLTSDGFDLIRYFHKLTKEQGYSQKGILRAYLRKGRGYIEELVH